MKNNLLHGAAALGCVSIVIGGVLLNEGRTQHRPQSRAADLNVLFNKTWEIGTTWNPTVLEHQFSPYGVGTPEEHAADCAYLAKHVGTIKAVKPLEGTELAQAPAGRPEPISHMSGHVLVQGEKGSATLAFVLGYDGKDWLIEAFGISKTRDAKGKNLGGKALLPASAPTSRKIALSAS